MESWVPLEANPDVMNKFLGRVGAVEGYSLVDVLGLDEEQLSWVPKPVLAVLLLFPCSEKYEAHKREEEKRFEENPPPAIPRELFFLEQKVQNACGTVALVHAVANNAASLRPSEPRFRQFLIEGADATPSVRGDLLAECQGVASAHAELANEGQSAAPGADEPVVHHFVCFVHCEGRLYELDGRKLFPVDHGPSSPDTLLRDAAEVCRQFTQRDPDEVDFTVVALAASRRVD